MKTGIFNCKRLNPTFYKLFLLGFIVFLPGIVIANKNIINDQDSKRLKNLNPAIENRIDSIISILSLEEKIVMLHGKNYFTSEGIPRLGIRELYYTDGPFGIREEMEPQSWRALGLTNDSATFLPTGSALAATWNPDLAYKYGLVLGEEAKTRGKDILLGPAVNITRSPLNGRTYEYMSEDPFLNSILTVSYVDGVQSTGVASCVKHYAVNNQETSRNSINVTLNERVLREIYLPAFRAAIEEGKAMAVMAAYNKFRGAYCAENDYLLNKILKKEWNFSGMVISDWGGTHSTVASALNGLDVEMGSNPRNTYFAKPLLDSVNSGKVPISVINDKVKRVLRVMLYAKNKGVVPANGIVSTPEHGKAAYDIASESIVLLKNTKNLLPINLKGVKKIAVIGDNATHKHALEGFGAGVKARYEITPLEGLKAKIGKQADILFVQGFKPKYLRTTGGAGRQTDDTSDSVLVKEAVSAALSSDITILFVGTNRVYETEGTDRLNLNLPWGQDALISAVTKANPNTIIVVVSGAPVDLKNTINSSSAIIWAGFNGSEGGNAIADVLLGNINPSGKLPLTFPVTITDSPVQTLKAVPGQNTVDYSEGLLVGYRWFDTKNVEPQFCFGYGLSYTNFTYSRFATNKKSFSKVDKIEISLKVKNTGNKAGKETVQVYITGEDQKVFKPVKELKAFSKVLVGAGKTIDVKMEIPVSDLAYFDEKIMKWVVSPGNYKVSAGSSSRDIRVSGLLTIKE